MNKEYNGLNDFKKYLDSKKRIVLKIGTQVLLNDKDKLSLSAFKRICSFSHSLIQQQKEVILVSSGAIAAGKDILNTPPPSNNFSMPEKQAFAACGQALLMKNYGSSFKKYGIKTAQILLTKDDISSRKRFVNARNTIYELLKNKVVPIINENDTISYEEIKFSDNDHLSALVSNLVCADLLIILSNVRGVYDKNPVLHKDAKLIKTIDNIKDFIRDFKETSKSLQGTGGMKSKLYASFIAAGAGIDTIIISGKDGKSLDSLADGILTGTFIPSLKNNINKKKHWLLFGMEKKGQIVIDKGAVDAIINKNKSLLASGILAVNGEFKKGEGVYIVNEEGKIFSIGISNFDSKDIKIIKGLKSHEIKTKFGEGRLSALVVHKDKLAVTA
ncbi:MAG: glutamate 5-kinase [Deltaproteobacteria bacterium]|jgi:glutamate 5-kinase|nr:glutamate 5-kinase [Deltaproteobacteria bacterium]MCL5879433.1 glutamate 5-kinase [Deltaproteobacteria bacterium]MDA8304448.1 glutamate 5-kinase [Deltaproteobacteria bacterium]